MAARVARMAAPWQDGGTKSGTVAAPWQKVVARVARVAVAWQMRNKQNMYPPPHFSLLRDIPRII